MCVPVPPSRGLPVPVTTLMTCLLFREFLAVYTN
jgi:hypothetical protein